MPCTNTFIENDLNLFGLNNTSEDETDVSDEIHVNKKLNYLKVLNYNCL